MENPVQEPSSNETLIEDGLTTPLTSKDKKPQLKLVVTGVLVALILIGLIIFSLVIFQENNDYNDINLEFSLSNQTENSIPTPSQATTTSYNSINPDAWEIILPPYEIKSQVSLIESSLVYAVKNDYQSVVYKKNLQDGTQEKIFEFDESLKADNSGNYWTGLTSNLALSNNKENLAFIDNEGLKVYNLQTKITRQFISKTERIYEGIGEESPDWSFNSKRTIFNLVKPLWSFNGKYISFSQVHHEGASFGVIDVETGVYSQLVGVFGVDNFSWSPASSRYMKVSHGEAYDGSGLLVSSESNIAEPDNIALKFSDTDRPRFLGGNFSPDGEKIVFVFWDDPEGEYLGTIDNDGTRFEILARTPRAKDPFFSNDGNSVLYFQEKDKRHVLVQYDLVNKTYKDIVVLPSEFNRREQTFWTKDGFLVLTGIYQHPNGRPNLEKITRMLILDISNKQVIYASPIFERSEQFTNFVGLLN